MAKRPNIIPKAPLARILMNAGAKRVSARALDVFTDIMQEITEKLGEKAVRLARHSGRKTVKDEDIKLAAK
jgi:histone H3/H4